MIVTTEAGVVNLLQDAMLTIATPILAAMFVSRCNAYLLKYSNVYKVLNTFVVLLYSPAAIIVSKGSPYNIKLTALFYQVSYFNLFRWSEFDSLLLVLEVCI